MKILFLTREYPPNVYGGAGVHVEYLAKEIAKLTPLEVRCFGDQEEDKGNLEVKGFDFSAANFSKLPNSR